MEFFILHSSIKIKVENKCSENGLSEIIYQNSPSI